MTEPGQLRQQALGRKCPGRRVVLAVHDVRGEAVGRTLPVGCGKDAERQDQRGVRLAVVGVTPFAHLGGVGIPELRLHAHHGRGLW